MSTTLLTMRGNINTEFRDTGNNRWLAAEKTLAINKAIKYIVNHLIRNKCWEPLAPLEIKATYTLVSGQDDYNVYTVIGSSTNFKAFVKAVWPYHGIRPLTVEEHNAVYDHATIRFWGYDATEGHGKLPTFTLKPEPTAADTFYFYYLKNVTDLSADADVPELLGCDELIEEIAKLYLTINDKDPNNAMMLWKSVDSKLDDLVAIHTDPVFYEIEDSPTW